MFAADGILEYPFVFPSVRAGAGYGQPPAQALSVPVLAIKGREYSTFVEVDGTWMYITRELRAETEAPEGWLK
jgi:hypothetical protein